MRDDRRNVDAPLNCHFKYLQQRRDRERRKPSHVSQRMPRPAVDDIQFPCPDSRSFVPHLTAIRDQGAPPMSPHRLARQWFEPHTTLDARRCPPCRRYSRRGMDQNASGSLHASSLRESRGHLSTALQLRRDEILHPARFFSWIPITRPRARPWHLRRATTDDVVYHLPPIRPCISTGVTMRGADYGNAAHPVRLRFRRGIPVRHTTLSRRSRHCIPHTV